MRGLYLHVPFCESRCSYCGFRTEAGAPEARQARWLAALRRELEERARGLAFDTVYAGGGTPTSLAPPVWRGFLETVAPFARAAAEATCEANPSSAGARTLDALRAAGFDRLSVGIQSMDDRALALLGRRHGAAEAAACVRRARAAGFDNLSVDLMFGLPGRSADDALADADALLELAPEHLSAYCLSVEPGTPLARDLAAGRRPAPDDDEAAEAYGRLRARLLGAGYEHYELSNFARPGRESAHNGLYWSGGEVLGCGPSAASFLGGERTRNAEATEAYCERMERTGGAVVETERLVGEAAAAEYLVFALRRTRGVGARSFRERTGFALEDFRAGEIRSLKERGLLEERGGRLRLTERALFVSDAVFRELI